jgi:hypothetical protein
MHFRNAFASSSFILLLLAVSGSVSSSALAADGADSKEACLSAADTGQSLRDDGQYAAARDQFLVCARDVCPKLVHEQCTEWLRSLDEATPTVVFGAKDDRGNDVGAARVLSDGKLVTSNLDGKPLLLDPGPHDIRFERDPGGAVTVHVVLRTGEKNREVTATFPTIEGQPSTPAEEGRAPASSTPGEESHASSSFWNARSVTSLSLLVGGAAAVGVGVFFGLQSQSEKSTADGILANPQPAGLNGNASACHAPDASTNPMCQNLSDTRDAQNRDAVLNEVLYVAGGVLAAGAVASWFLWPKRQEEHVSKAWIVPTLGPGHAGVGVGGAF